jgi:hypothetical protein
VFPLFILTVAAARMQLTGDRETIPTASGRVRSDLKEAKLMLSTGNFHIVLW